MKRVGNLWPRIVSFENLYGAAEAAAQGKRKRPDVARFLLNLETEICALQRDLAEGVYTHGPYRSFEVRDSKPRTISAAAFRDRVVHHALTRVIEPIFERRFSAHSYACRTGYGTLRAVAHAREACRRYPYALKCDVAQFFASIDHGILMELLERVIKCPSTLALAAHILGTFAVDEGPDPLYFDGDNLFTPFDRVKGLPLGNQTSQFFGNVYLNELDHFIERKLTPGSYVRYVDDFLLFDRDKASLGAALAGIGEFLERFRVRVHSRKSRVYRVRDGVTFLGWRLFPDRARLVRSNVVRARRRLKFSARDHNQGRITTAEFRCRVCGWLGHARHGDTWRVCHSVLAGCKLVAAERHRNARGVVEQQPGQLARLEP